jgi:membrane protein involved in colicin uptake
LQGQSEETGAKRSFEPDHLKLTLLAKEVDRRQRNDEERARVCWKQVNQEVQIQSEEGMITRAGDQTQKQTKGTNRRVPMERTRSETKSGRKAAESLLPDLGTGAQVGYTESLAHERRKVWFGYS